MKKFDGVGEKEGDKMDKIRFKEFLDKRRKVLKFENNPLDVEWEYDLVKNEDVREGDRDNDDAEDCNVYSVKIKFNKLPNNFIYYIRNNWQSDSKYSVLSVIENTINFIYYEYNKVSFEIRDIKMGDTIEFRNTEVYKLKEKVKRINEVLKKCRRGVLYRENSFDYSNLFLCKNDSDININNLIHLRRSNNENEYEKLLLSNNLERIDKVYINYRNLNKKDVIESIETDIDNVVDNYSFVSITNNIRSIVDHINLSTLSIIYYPTEIDIKYILKEEDGNNENNKKG